MPVLKNSNLDRFTVVYLSGGFGNQLHQISTALGLSRYCKVQISTARLGRTGRVFDSLPIVKNTKLVISSDFCNCAKETAPQQMQSIDLLDPPCCLLTYPDQIDWQFHVTDPLVFYELIKSSLNMKSPSTVGISNEYVIHFRLGDYLFPTARAYGVLHTKYFKRCLEALGAPREIVVFSDDPKGVNRIYGKAIGNSRLIHSNIRSVLEDFTIMGTAKNFVASNSTLSMWICWYRNIEAQFSSDIQTTFAPKSIYKRRSPNVPGLGEMEPIYFNQLFLMLRYPWIISRSLRWKGIFW